MTCPCGICEERFVGCHAECDAYKAWQNDRREIIKQRKVISEKKALVHDYVAETGAALRKRRRGKR